MHIKLLLFVILLYNHTYTLFITNIDNLIITFPLIINRYFTSENRIYFTNTLSLNTESTIFNDSVHIINDNNSLILEMQNLATNIDSSNYFVTLNTANRRVEKKNIPITEGYASIFTNNINAKGNQDLIIETIDDTNTIYMGKENIIIQSPIIQVNTLSSQNNTINFNCNVSLNDINSDKTITIKNIIASLLFQIQKSNILIKSPLNIICNNFTSKTVHTNISETDNPDNNTILMGKISVEGNFFIDSDTIQLNNNETTNNPPYFLALDNDNVFFKTTIKPIINTVFTTIIENTDTSLTLKTKTIDTNNTSNSILFNTQIILLNSEIINNISHIQKIQNKYNTLGIINGPLKKISINSKNEDKSSSCVINESGYAISFSIQALENQTLNEMSLLSQFTQFLNILPTSTYAYLLTLKVQADHESFYGIYLSPLNSINKNPYQSSVFMNGLGKILDMYCIIDNLNTTIQDQLVVYKNNTKEYKKINKSKQKLYNDIKIIKNQYEDNLNNDTTINELFSKFYEE